MLVNQWVVIECFVLKCELKHNLIKTLQFLNIFIKFCFYCVTEANHLFFLIRAIHYKSSASVSLGNWILCATFAFNLKEKTRYCLQRSFPGYLLLVWEAFKIRSILKFLKSLLFSRHLQFKADSSESNHLITGMFSFKSCNNIKKKKPTAHGLTSKTLLGYSAWGTVPLLSWLCPEVLTL